MNSSTPKEALNMHRDLLNWEQALKLATRLAIEEIPYISKEYALQLEFTFAVSDVPIYSVAHIVCSGQYFDALGTYERAVTNIAKVLPPHKTKISFVIIFCSSSFSSQDRVHNDQCKAGIARMVTRTGDIKRFGPLLMSYI